MLILLLCLFVVQLLLGHCVLESCWETEEKTEEDKASDFLEDISYGEKFQDIFQSWVAKGP